jgi:glucose-6-phosphate isomerase
MLLSSLSPATLGALIALYEHAVFTHGVVLGINSFDQWGVELGKQLAIAVMRDLERDTSDDVRDPSTSALMRWYRQHR